jgi:hypothetical protein
VVVDRARREDLEVPVSYHPFGDEPAEMLRTPADLGPIALHDERDPRSPTGGVRHATAAADCEGLRRPMTA